MTRPRSIFALMMAFLMAFLVSCSSVEAKVPTTYTAAQTQQFQRYVPTLTEFRSRMDNTGTLIQRRNWVDQNYIHEYRRLAECNENSFCEFVAER